ncbi:hypothetical protein GIY23_04855 [Allosaccharopolyspora coralli]|uniref:Ava_C0101 and related proteins n=1 Tax=Allosaccharopolyspora coralli TaxID=2665642 RepID=A0A5Q3Q674_9PSEU|nr:DUF5996 family protein [Allosaccharopolyspora coralli]QGK68956.1 hypothetical protein GIY23_04855 [Allosaccharopolyspora coralli]
MTESWPALRVDDWADTRDTLHMWTQIVGKIRMAQAPMLNHWWQVPLYVTPRGLTTSSIPHGDQLFDMEFDFVDHRLRMRSSSGEQRDIALEPKTVATFYQEVMATLADMDLDVSIMTSPVEVERSVPFPDDTELASYDPDHVTRFWGQLLAADRVLNEFRARFIAKSSPVHVFWGALDMACTRFSGNTAPPHPGGVPNCADWVMVEGYSHELASCGFWPGGSAEGTFYAYAYPEPDGYREHPVRPTSAYYDTGVNEFLLPYEAVRTSSAPDATLLDFFQTTYDAVAEAAGWDRDALEDHPDRRAAPR